MKLKNLNLDSTALRYFQAAATLKSIRRAAESLNVSASALSRQIAALENVLQISLFERLPRGLRPTTAGEILLMHVEESFRELKRGLDAIDDLKTLRRGHINAALVESAALGLLSPALSSFWAKHPKIEVSLQVVGTFDVLRQLERGDADVGLAFNIPARTDLPIIKSVALPLGIVMSPRHPLARRSSLLLDDLIGVPVIVSDSSLMLHSALSDVRKSLPLTVRAVTNSITAMSLLAACENGVALKTIVGVNDQIRRGELRFVPISDRRLPAQRLAIVTRRVLPMPALVRMLAEEFASELERVCHLGTSEKVLASIQ